MNCNGRLTRHVDSLGTQRVSKSAMQLQSVQALKAGDTGDEDIIRLAAEDAELARAKERLTLKHRNSSKWARRALKRGMDVMDEGTKAAVAEQLRLGEELRRKVCSKLSSCCCWTPVTCGHAGACFDMLRGGEGGSDCLLSVVYMS